MSTRSPARKTVAEMWELFQRTATRGRASRKLSSEHKATYYSACSHMLTELIEIFRVEEPDYDVTRAKIQKLADELEKFESDFREGMI